MPEISTDTVTAIPLTRFDAKRSNKVLILFTREQGQIRVHSRGSAGRGAKRGRSKQAHSVFSLFSTYEILLVPPKTGTGLFEAGETRLVTSRPKLNEGSPIEPWAVGSILSEILFRTMAQHDPHPYLFEMLTGALDRLEESAPPTPLLVAFLLKFLEHMGYKPRLDRTLGGAVVEPGNEVLFDVERGGVCSGEEMADRDSPIGRRVFRVDAETRTTLENLRLARFDRLDTIPLPANFPGNLIDLLEAYVERHFETRLKSVGFWKDLRRIS